MLINHAAPRPPLSSHCGLTPQRARPRGAEAGQARAVAPAQPVRARAPCSDFAAPPRVDAARAPAAPLPVALADYPASNDPAMWQLLHGYIQQSPTLRQQLSLLRQAQWVILWSAGRGGLCAPWQRQVQVGTGLSPPEIMQILAHETGHAFDPMVHPQHYSNEMEFLDANMRNEAGAVCSHLRVRDEILANSGADIGIVYNHSAYYGAAQLFYKRHGCFERLLNHVKQMCMWAVSGLTQTSYSQTFVNDYRFARNMPPLRLPPQFLYRMEMQAWQRLHLEMQRG